MLFPIEYSKLDISKFIFIDVRSEKEFEKETIPGSINIPIFNNEERELVGTTYKKNPSSDSKLLGVSIVSKKLPKLYEKLIKLKYENKKNIIIFCDNGGMRSSSIALLMHSTGVNINYLKGGYKAYRKFIREDLPKLNDEVTYIVLHGKTGSGKTILLHKLEELNLDVLDLEGAANHRGSLLGSVGLGNCNTTKQFESNIYNTLINRNSNHLFVEAESRKIGKVYVPEYIHSKMKNGIHLYIETPIELRASLLVDEYITNDKSIDELIYGINLMKKHMKNSDAEKLINNLRSNKVTDVAITLMKDYYDPMYLHSSNKYNFINTFNVINFNTTANEINNWYKSTINICEK
ncbi:MAG: tRNA 2-selenouridine(34) synthase MnmH [Bacillota bacterium]|nr:tRNA 2-selenouridine(34) synthase MnmH [Bacillota bacterium]